MPFAGHRLPRAGLIVRQPCQDARTGRPFPGRCVLAGDLASPFGLDRFHPNEKRFFLNRLDLVALLGGPFERGCDLGVSERPGLFQLQPNLLEAA